MSAPAAEPGDIAIIGMACLFPGAPDLETYWQNIVNGVDSVTDPPEEAWDAETFYDPDASSNDRVYCKRGGHIGPLAFFDPLANGVMPKAVEGGEPDQWLALKVAREALADAGYDEEIPERRNAAVILGKGTYLNRGNISVVQHGRVVDQTLRILATLHPEYGDDELELIRADLKRALPPFNADTAPSLIPNVVAGRIANRLDLMGPNYTVDAACASSLVALEHAVRGLTDREFDLALVGGVHVATPVPTLMLFCQMGALSRQERLRPFDRSADGTLLGGGVGMVVLKRLEDAEREGKRIYATIKGVGVSSDGKGLGVTAPRLDGEVLALRRAYEKAGLSPLTVELIEAHGTGTPVGDQTEVKALHTVFGAPEGTLPRCALGSVKSMISHLMPAAGIAGLMKVALALHDKVLPPTLNVEEPNPDLELDTTNFYLNSETRPWIHGRGDDPRRAGINAFGFGGINAHAIVEEYSPPGGKGARGDQSLLPWDSEVLLLSSESREGLVERLEGLRELLDGDPDTRLADLAFTLNVPWDPQAFRLALVASEVADLRPKVEKALARLGDPDCGRIKDVQGIFFARGPEAISGKLAFVFPGEGSQYVNMLADLCMRFPEVRRNFDLIDRIFAAHRRQFVPSDFVFPRPAFSDEDRRTAAERLWRMEGAFEAVQTANWALYSLLDRLQLRPDAMVGHSTGEYTAMLASGVIHLGDDRRVARFATELNDFYHQQAAKDGNLAGAVLLAVAADGETVERACGGDGGSFHVAMNNCPHQTVIVTRDDEVEPLLESLQDAGLIYERLPFDRPYHTPWFAGCAERLRNFLSHWIVAAPALTTYSCTTGGPFPTQIDELQQLAVEHWRSPVEFQRTIERMYGDGVRVFVEVGPRGSLSAFIDDILHGRPHLAVPVNSSRRSGIRQLNTMVGLLAAHGVPLQPDYLYQRRRVERVALEPAAESSSRSRRQLMKLETNWIPMELSEETAAQLRDRGESKPAAVAEETGAGSAAVDAEGTSESIVRTPLPTESPADQVMTAHHRTMERFLTLQEEVMASFLSTSDAGFGGRSDPVSPGAGAAATSGAASAVPAEAPEATAAETEPAGPASRGDAESGEGGGAESPAVSPTGDIQELLLQIVSDRTGYPSEMLGLDLDLEADLGIDSIKRVEILGSLQQQTGVLQDEDMEALSACKTLREVIEFFTRQVSSGEPASATDARPTAPARPGDSSSSSMPLLGRVVSLSPGSELEAYRRMDVAEDLFLRDHVLGRRVSSSEPELTGLPVMPLTVSMEMLAEAAAVLVPDRVLVAMREIKARRWVALDEGSVTLRITGRVDEADPSSVRVRLFEAPDSGSAPADGETAIVEGLMLFADAYPESPPAPAFSPAGAEPSRWSAETLYEEGMFHGPAFRGVESMERCGSDGAVALVRVLPREGLFEGEASPALVTDAVLLDQPGQVVGLWTAERLDRGAVIFPFRLDRLELYGPPLAVGEELRCDARITLEGEQLVTSDLDVVTSDGRIWARLVGWRDRRFDLPAPFVRFLRRPVEEMLSEPWTPAVPGGWGEVEACRLAVESLPTDPAAVAGGLWARALARLVLSAVEQEAWRSVAGSENRRLRWLLERLAAKDAVRRFLSQRAKLAVSPADIVIRVDEEGRSVAHGDWVADVGGAPRVATSASDGIAVAVVADGGSVAGLGVDIGRPGEVEAPPLAAEEKGLLAPIDQSGDDDWPLRIACAKRAAAEALGWAPSRARKLTVERLDSERGAVELRLAPDEEAENHPAPTGVVVAQTSRESGLVAAISVNPLPAKVPS